MGGLLIFFSFVDQPQDIFTSWVYSDVDETTGEVSNYRVVIVKHEDVKSGKTREDLLKEIKENPELKLF